MRAVAATRVVTASPHRKTGWLELDRWVDEPLTRSRSRRPCPGLRGGTLSAVAQMIRRRARIEDGAPPEPRAPALGSAWRRSPRRRASDAGRAPSIHCWAAGSTTSRPRRAVRAWRRFSSASRAYPGHPRLEDLQWADRADRFIGTWHMEQDPPIVILAMARPELLDADHMGAGRALYRDQPGALPDARCASS